MTLYHVAILCILYKFIEIIDNKKVYEIKEEMIRNKNINFNLFEHHIYTSLRDQST